jgi:hypothetical protein
MLIWVIGVASIAVDWRPCIAIETFKLLLLLGCLCVLLHNALQAAAVCWSFCELFVYHMHALADLMHTASSAAAAQQSAAAVAAAQQQAAAAAAQQQAVLCMLCRRETAVYCSVSCCTAPCMQTFGWESCALLHVTHSNTPVEQDPCLG